MNFILTGLILLTSVALIEMYGKRGRHFLIETRDKNENGLDYDFTVRGKSKVLHHTQDATVFECHGTVKASCQRGQCTALCEDGSNFALYCPDGGFGAIENRVEGEECKQHELTCKYFKTQYRCAA